MKKKGPYQGKADNTVTSWLRLMRVPNLFTVILEPVAGYVCVTGRIDPAACAAPVISIVLIYIAGLLLSDVADEEKDRMERPDRPLPSGRLRKETVNTTGWACLIAGIAIAAIAGTEACYAVSALALLVLIYARIHSKFLLTGAFIMAACRAVAVLAGAGAAGSTGQAYLPALTAFIYIFMLTVCAAGETLRPKLAFWTGVLPAMALFIPLFYAVRLTGPACFWAVLFLITAAGHIILSAYTCSRKKTTIPQHIGVLIRTIIFIQGAWLILYWSEFEIQTALLITIGVLFLRVTSEYLAQTYSSS